MKWAPQGLRTTTWATLGLMVVQFHKFPMSSLDNSARQQRTEEKSSACTFGTCSLLRLRLTWNIWASLAIYKICSSSCSSMFLGKPVRKQQLSDTFRSWEEQGSDRMGSQSRVVQKSAADIQVAFRDVFR